MAHARQLERLELDSVISVPMLDLAFASEQMQRGSDPFSARVGLVALRGSFTVAYSHRLVGVISDDIKDHQVVIFDFSAATYIDDSAAMLIHQLIGVATQEHTEVVVAGVSGSVAETLDALGILRQVPGDRIVETRGAARTVAFKLIGESAAAAGFAARS